MVSTLACLLIFRIVNFFFILRRHTSVNCLQSSLSYNFRREFCKVIINSPSNESEFLRRWYAVQKTTTKSTCLIYNFEEGLKPGEYLLKQTSERHPINLNISYVFDYTGKIGAEKNSSKMTIHFPLNIAGSAPFDVVTTDYETYAGIYTCQNLLFFKRQSATFLSRTSKLDEDILKKMKHMFDENISDLQLNSISHDNCNAAESQILLKVKSNLASSINISRMVPTHPSKEIDRRIADGSYEEPSVEHISDAENFIDPRFSDDDQDVVWVK